MEFVSIRDFRASSGQIWEKVANNEEIVITNHGQPTVFLVHIPTGYFDETLQNIRQAKRNLNIYMNAKRSNPKTEFAQQREQFFNQRPALKRQEAWERVRAAFTQTTADVDLDKEREERIMGKHEHTH